jgi:hypothetical protein
MALVLDDPPPPVAASAPAPVPGAAPSGLVPIPAQPPVDVPAAAPAVAAPIPVPALTAPVTAPPPVDPVAAAEQNAAATRQTGQELTQVSAEKTQLEQQKADEQSRFDQAHAQALEAFQKEQAQHRAAADAEITAKRHQYETAPFHSLWSTRTTGEKVAIALGLLAGGIGWNSNHQNRALQELDNAEQEDLNLQKEQHADLWRDLQLSLDNRKELDSRQLHELSDWQAKEAAKWTAVASRLNSLLIANKGRGDTATVQAAANEANEKANTAWQNAINARGTAKHLEAQTNLTNEDAKTQASVRAKNYAEANNANALASNGGLSKFDQQLALRIPTMLQRDPDVKALYGAPGQPGPLTALPKIAELQDAIKTAIENHDQAGLAQAVIAAREQLPKLYTGTDVTKPKSELLESLQGSPEQIQSKVNRLLGDPSVGAKFAHEIYGLLDGAREGQLKVADAARNRLQNRHINTPSPFNRNPAIKAELVGQVNAITSGVQNGGGAPRYPEGGAGTAQPQQQASQYPVGTRATSGGKPIMWDGAKWVPVK